MSVTESDERIAAILREQARDTKRFAIVMFIFSGLFFAVAGSNLVYFLTR